MSKVKKRKAMEMPELKEWVRAHYVSDRLLKILDEDLDAGDSGQVHSTRDLTQEKMPREVVMKMVQKHKVVQVVSEQTGALVEATHVFGVHTRRLTASLILALGGVPTKTGKHAARHLKNMEKLRSLLEELQREEVAMRVKTAS